MALKPKVFKVNIQIANMDRHYYNDHLLTIAQHPSETDERVMVRLLAFALNANENLVFTDGITDNDHADLLDKNPNEQINLWISIGLPDEKLIKKAVSRATQVIIYAYGGRIAEVWWSKLKLNNYSNLKVYILEDKDTKLLTTMLSRGMKMNFTIQDGDIMVANESTSLDMRPFQQFPPTT